MTSLVVVVVVLCLRVCLLLPILWQVKSNLIIVFIFAYMNISEIEHLFTHSLTSCVFSSVKWLYIYSVHFSIDFPSWLCRYMCYSLSLPSPSASSTHTYTHAHTRMHTQTHLLLITFAAIISWFRPFFSALSSKK